MSVDTKSGAGRAFLRSLYQQYTDWGVDFGNMLIAEISFFSHYFAIAHLSIQLKLYAHEYIIIE